MTLKEQFLKASVIEGVVDNSEVIAATNAMIADEFAIGFAEWHLNLSKSDDWEKFDYNTTEKLLEIYKKEKGL